MEKILLFKDVIRTIQGGKFFASLMGWLVRITGAALIVPVILMSINIWQIAGREGQPIDVVIYGIMAQVIFLAAYYWLFNLLWLRGTDIHDLPLSPEYNATPVIVLLIKTGSEVLGSVILFAGMLITLAVWLAPAMAYQVGLSAYLGPVAQVFNNSFLNGVAVILVSAVAGISTLVVGYFLAEFVGALVAIARNTKKRR